MSDRATCVHGCGDLSWTIKEYGKALLHKHDCPIRNACQTHPEGCPSDLNDCRVYWGSHGCRYPRGHDGDHFCCCECDNHPDSNSGCVGASPYYGPITRFYGEDATDE